MGPESDININPRENNFTSPITINNSEKVSNNKHEVEESVTLNDKGIAIEQTETNANSTLEKKISESEIQEALDVVSAFMSHSFKHVGFSNDTSSGKTIIKVIDKETQELISQFPSDKMLTMAEKIKSLHQEIESVSGLLIDSHV
tara:strand:+ start:5346 stop:5780 length:435 start_codon:yes stop_codon:yes gene_type:complete